MNLKSSETTPNDLYFTVLTIVLVLIARAAFLQYLDLIDPTEARYASVAQDMLLSNDWITPKLHMSEGLVPYMGKPPLHYWLTATAYYLFGISEWSSRLPSLLSAILILGAVFLSTRTYRGLHEAAGTSMVLATSVLFFFLAGASVTDVTMTALVTISILIAYPFLIAKESAPNLIISAALFTGFAFLCKGPFTSVLIALPLLLWSAARRNFSWLQRIPWVTCMTLFALTVIPWFLWSEFRLPGFLKYFVWNENIGRYLVKEYGDKYGLGHTHAYGTSWLIVTSAFLPWSLLLLWSVVTNGVRTSARLIKSDPYLLLGFCWAISAPLFLTFMKNFHAMYLLPAMPGLAIITGPLFMVALKNTASFWHKLQKPSIIRGTLLLWIILATAGAILEFSYLALIVSAGTILLGISYLVLVKRSDSGLAIITTIGWIIAISYITVIAAFTPHINSSRSSRAILQALVKYEANNTDDIRVGLPAQNKFSYFWLANTWASDPEKRDLKVTYIDPAHLTHSDVTHYLIKSAKKQPPAPEVLANFNLIKQIGDWKLFKRKAT